jgi:hypothetical protein
MGVKRNLWSPLAVLLVAAGMVAACGGGESSPTAQAPATAVASPGSMGTGATVVPSPGLPRAGATAVPSPGLPGTGATVVASPGLPDAEAAAVPSPGLPGAEAMAVDAVSGGAVDASRVVTGSDPFDVDIVILSGASGYQGYQYKLEWDPSVLAYDHQKHLMPAELNFCADAIVGTSDVYTGCARSGGDTTFVGPLNTVTLHCIGAGVSPLHLKTMTEDVNFGTSVVGDVGILVDTSLTDASVTCR